MAIASAYVENLKENINENKKEQYLNSIGESIDYMNRLINDILEFSNAQYSAYEIKETDEFKLSNNNRGLITYIFQTFKEVDLRFC